MSWTSLREWFERSLRTSKVPTRPRKRFELEHLEGRLTPSALHVTLHPPATVTDPVNTSSSSTDTASFTIKVTGGTGTRNILWYEFVNGTPQPLSNNSTFSGVTTDTLTAVVPSMVETEQFIAIVTDTNAQGKITADAKSGIATLTTEVPVGTATPIRVTEDGSAITVTNGTATVTPGKVVLSSSDTGTPPTGHEKLKVEWLVSKDGGATFHDIDHRIKNEISTDGTTTTSTLTFHATGLDDGNIYKVVFSNDISTTGANSPTVTLAVTSKPVIAVQPHSELAPISGAANPLTVVVKGAPDVYTYQWYTVSDHKLTALTNGTNSNGVTYSGVTTATLGITNSTKGPTHYLVKITNANGTTTSERATVHGIDATPPTKDQDPTNQTVTAGSMVTFSAEVTGTAPMSVVWLVSSDGGKHFHRVNDASVTVDSSLSTGITTTTLSFTASADENNDEYKAVFTNALGEGYEYTTAPATLTVTK
jgi:hypothetical protein